MTEPAIRILVLSDLHREVWGETGDAPHFAVETSRPDVVVLAGDIDVGTQAIQWMDNAFAGIPVIYVPGNHEGYGHHWDKVQTELVMLTEQTDHVHVLNPGEAVIGNVRFLGATLWTDFMLFGQDMAQLCLNEAGASMNDYRRIRLANRGYRKLRPLDTLGWHHQQRKWLEAKLAEPFAGKTVVVSHMAPSIQSIQAEYLRDPVSAAYASNLETLAEKADVWIHGHTHASRDYDIGTCRVVANPRGYRLGDRPQNPRFDPNFIIEV